jgi:hypothetical protein
MMPMQSQSEEQRREKRAIDLFVSLFNGSYQKLDPNDIDYKVFDQDKNLIAYAEVVSVFRVMREAYPVPIDAKKLIKLADKRLNPVVIWSCEDGIIYCKTNKLDGTIKWEDDEFTVYADKVRAMKYIRFT